MTRCVCVKYFLAALRAVNACVDVRLCMRTHDMV